MVGEEDNEIMKQILTKLMMMMMVAFVMSAYSEDAKTKDAPETGRWSKEKANKWYAEQPWLVGCNFISSTAINQLEMWQEDTFDSETIDRELKGASEMGMNSVHACL